MVSITSAQIDVPAVFASVATAHTDGIDVFVHSVRSHSHGRRVQAVEYVTDVPQAREVLAAIEQSLRKKWCVDNVALIHRIGVMKVGQAAFVAAVSGANSRQTFEACCYATESIQSTIPFQKREIYEEGLAWFVGQHDVDVCGIAA
jgi:molybdopterin synthase catalytic subunit